MNIENFILGPSKLWDLLQLARINWLKEIVKPKNSVSFYHKKDSQNDNP